MFRSRDDDGCWQGRSALATDINTPLSISLLIDRYDSRRVAGQLVDDRNVIICGAGNGCDHPFPSLPAALAPTCPPPPSLSLSPSLLQSTSPWQILPPARLFEPAVNRDWDPLVGLGLLTRNACDRLHSELIRSQYGSCNCNYASRNCGRSVI